MSAAVASSTGPGASRDPAGVTRGCVARIRAALWPGAPSDLVQVPVAAEFHRHQTGDLPVLDA